VVISVRISRRVPQRIMKIMSEGSRNEGKQIQLSKLTRMSIAAIDPIVRVKYISKFEYLNAFLLVSIDTILYRLECPDLYISLVMAGEGSGRAHKWPEKIL